MTSIRPNIGSYTPPQQGDAGRLAAQRAFFTLAGQAPAQAAAPAAQTPQTAVATAPQPVRAAAAEAPQKILRPGSLLDIRV